jgi:hypothetical protein
MLGLMKEGESKAKKKDKRESGDVSLLLCF